ncbi:MAG: ABC transporter permease [Myxococcota bacterium]
MLRNYFVSAYRNLLKSPLYAAINIVGLGIGLAACILITLYVQGEFSFDRWVKDADRIYTVNTSFEIPGRPTMRATAAPGPARDALKEYFPQIEEAARVHDRRPKVKRGDKLFFDPVYLVDGNFFDVIDAEFIEGNPTDALKDTSSIILSESMRDKYFGDEDPIGQTLFIDDNVRARDYRVAAIIKDSPKNSAFEWSIIGRLEPEEWKSQPWVVDQWTSVNTMLFVKVKPGTDAAALNAQLPEFERRMVPDVSFGGKLYPVHDFIELSLLPFLDLHLHAITQMGAHASSAYTQVITFAAVAILILIIACINFMNLSTARASQRAREVSMRKVVGAGRAQLVGQFLGESVFLALIALALALALVELALPTYNEILDRELVLTLIGSSSSLPAIAGLVAFVGLVGGAYPALYLARFQPARVLRANKSSDAGGSGRVRNMLVVLQFAISIALMICTAVVYQQYQFSQNKDLGFDKDNVLVVRGIGLNEADKVKEVLRKEITALPNVVGVTLSSDAPADSNESNAPIQVPGRKQDEPIILGHIKIDHSFNEVYGIDVIAGRDFDLDHPTDNAKIVKAGDADGENPHMSIMLNESAVRQIGYLNPQDAIGKNVSVLEGDKKGIEATIIGVVRDWHFKSVREQIRPTFYEFHPDRFNDLSVRYEGDGGAIEAKIEEIWRRVVPGLPFRAQYLSENIARLYEDEQARAKMFGAFSALAIIIACLGLYGLASFTAARRTKEIGIRKVLGASSGDIVKLLVWQFSKPVLIANLVAWPVAAYLMQDWLEAFEYRIGLSPILFVSAALAGLAIAWLTVGGHALRFARIRPSYSLRYE